MRDGFVKVAVRTPQVRVADVDFNVGACKDSIAEAAALGAKVIVLPELCVTGCTCEDLYLQDMLVEAAREGVITLAEATEDVDALVFVGAPIVAHGKLYDCAIAISHGEVLGVVPKNAQANHGGSFGARHFNRGSWELSWVDLGRGPVPFGVAQLFRCAEMEALTVAVEVSEDLLAPQPPSVSHALAGATIIVNLAATPATIGGADAMRTLVATQSARLACGYALASAGTGESSTDAVYAGQGLIAERGRVLAEAKAFGDGRATSEVDVAALASERRRVSTFEADVTDGDGYEITLFSLRVTACELTRPIVAHPFVPDGESERSRRCEEVLEIQAHALAKRLDHTHSRCAVIGISGGLDSTLALLVTVRAFDLLGLDRSGIIAVTMPGFGTTNRTHDNAATLAEALGVRFREVGIAASVRQHFADIGHDESVHDVTYENAQARERTQIIMDIANQEGGLVVGTGDLSELVLGWATYNGDHMSMYGVNGDVPKTLIRHLVRHIAETCGNDVERSVLIDVVETPVSPELLPANEDGTIAQQTEDLVGPYELHDFVLYQVLRFGFRPRKVHRLARLAFAGTYDDATILKWLTTFYRRFFAQQFKRSCLPDGPKVGSVGVSPRGDLRMPSDAVAAVWLKEAESLA